MNDARHDRIPETALNWRRSGKGAALATVLETWGSAPRPVGSQLAISGDGEIEGSVSGGCVEGAVVEEALESLRHGQPKVLEFGVADEDAFAVGLACGGRIRVLVEPVGDPPGMAEGDLALLVEARRAKKAAAMLVNLKNWERRFVSGEEVNDNEMVGERARADSSGFTNGWFVGIHNPPLRMIIVGAVHIAQPLLPMARLAGYDAALVEPREAFGTESRFPGEEISCAWPDEAIAEAKPDGRTAIVTLTHDPKIDDPAIRAALHSNAFYIGCLGSTRTHAKRLERLRSSGVAEADLSRLHAPVGADIGARSPAEIAISIMAEITERLRKGDSRAMKFGRVGVQDSEGAILAHSLLVEGRKIRKGRCLTASDVNALAESGMEAVTVAQLESGDLDENEAAARIAAKITVEGSGLSASAAFTGRVNIYAEAAGLLRLDSEAVLRANNVDHAITLATLPDCARLKTRSMAGTVKIITYGVSAELVAEAAEMVEGAMRLRRVAYSEAGLIVTEVQGLATRLTAKGRSAIEARLNALGIKLSEFRIVHHDAESIGKSLRESRAAVQLILTASATSDSADVGPEGLRAAGGVLHRFGMPVDPGNLLFLGSIGNRPVIGLPGCARSPALNGADWVLERIACGIAPEAIDIAAMGAGGLLKEISSRPQPRGSASALPSRPRVEALVFSVGSSADLGDVLAAIRGSCVERIVCAAPLKFHPSIRAAAGAEIELVVAPDSSGWLAESISAGIVGISPGADCVLLVRADSFSGSSGQIDRLAAAFSPEDGREICRLGGERSRMGPPVLFGKRFFESLAGLRGERGAAELMQEAADFVVEIDP